MRITKAAAQDLAAELHRMAERSAEQGYYRDSSDVANTANELDAAIAEMQDGGLVEVPLEAKYVAEDLGLI